MKLTIQKPTEVEVSTLIVEAEPRYWEDAEVNGVSDEDGTMIPFRDGALWKPIIDLDTGIVWNWPLGTKADIYYRVCYAGQYWLGDAAGNKLLKWNRDYVPSEILAPFGEGYGDYIILKIDNAGKIEGWNPRIDATEWSRTV